MEKNKNEELLKDVKKVADDIKDRLPPTEKYKNYIAGHKKICMIAVVLILFLFMVGPKLTSEGRAEAVVKDSIDIAMEAQKHAEADPMYNKSAAYKKDNEKMEKCMTEVCAAQWQYGKFLFREKIDSYEIKKTEKVKSENQNEGYQVFVMINRELRQTPAIVYVMKDENGDLKIAGADFK